MSVSEYILKNRSIYLTPRIVCADGLRLSVQAGDTHYCSPRDMNGPYYEVEVGFPSQPIDALMEYAEDPKDPTGTVYGYVPVSVVDAVIKEHGGMVNHAVD